jgi:predicted nucleotidyltransferase component of viral defense system
LKSDVLKREIRRMSSVYHIDPQELLQAFFLERLLERISKSQYKNNFILKGGLLIASMIGISSRTTKDIDATIKEYPVTEEKISDMLTDILCIKGTDDVDFEIQSIKAIREESEYNGYRCVLVCYFERIKQHIKVDISTGDIMTPSEVEYSYISNFGYEDINIMSYNLETIFAEKLESIMSKAEATTRMRDFYDVYILYNLYKSKINLKQLITAINSTASARGTIDVLNYKVELLKVIKESIPLKKLWKAYSNKYEYAKNIEYEQIIDVLEEIMNQI